MYSQRGYQRPKGFAVPGPHHPVAEQETPQSQKPQHRCYSKKDRAQDSDKYSVTLVGHIPALLGVLTVKLEGWLTYMTSHIPRMSDMTPDPAACFHILQILMQATEVRFTVSGAKKQ